MFIFSDVVQILFRCQPMDWPADEVALTQWVSDFHDTCIFSKIHNTVALEDYINLALKSNTNSYS